MKEFGPIGGRAGRTPPLDPPMHYLAEPGKQDPQK